MSREAQRKLREIMQTEFRSFSDRGYEPRPADIVALIQSDHPELIAELQSYLTSRALHDIAGEVARSRRSVAEKGPRQLVLPGMEKDLLERLPSTLSIPVNGRSHDIEYVPAHAATLVEWREYLDHLLFQSRGLGMTIAAIQEVIERGSEACCPADMPLLLWLSKQASTAEG